MNKKLLVVVAFFVLFKKWRGSSFQPSRDEFVASKKQMAPSLLPFSFMAVRLGKFSAIAIVGFICHARHCLSGSSLSFYFQDL